MHKLRVVRKDSRQVRTIAEIRGVGANRAFCITHCPAGIDKPFLEQAAKLATEEAEKEAFFA